MRDHEYTADNGSGRPVKRHGRTALVQRQSNSVELTGVRGGTRGGLRLARTDLVASRTEQARQAEEEGHGWTHLHALLWQRAAEALFDSVPPPASGD